MEVNFVNDANLNFKSNTENILDGIYIYIKPDFIANSFINSKYKYIVSFDSDYNLVSIQS